MLVNTTGWSQLPLYVLAMVIIYILYRRQIYIQRKSFYTRLTSAAKETGRSVLWGGLAGLVVSLLMSVVGTKLESGAVWWLWAFTLLGVVFRVRFFCMAYAVGAVGILHGLTAAIPAFGAWAVSSPITAPLTTVHVPSLLLVVAFLHCFEAFSMQRESLRAATPLYVQGKRGKTVGAFQLQRYCPIPLFLLVPATGGSGFEAEWPLLSTIEAGAAGWSLLFVPFVIGYSERTETLLPAQKGYKTSLRLYVYSLAALALAFIGEWLPPATIVCALLAIGLHETVRYIGAREERLGSPRFAADADGLKLLGALPGSPAAQMGIRPGEIVVRANGIPVRDRDGLHAALQENPAFCKLEVINLEGETKFLQRPIYAGDHHLLGLLPVPAADDKRGMERRDKTAFSGWSAFASDSAGLC